MVGEQRARAVQPARSEEVPLSLRLGKRMADKMTTGSRDGGGFLDLNYGRSFAGILKAVQAVSTVLSLGPRPISAPNVVSSHVFANLALMPTNG